MEYLASKNGYHYESYYEEIAEVHDYNDELCLECLEEHLSQDEKMVFCQSKSGRGYLGKQ